MHRASACSNRHPYMTPDTHCRVCGYTPAPKEPAMNTAPYPLDDDAQAREDAEYIAACRADHAATMAMLHAAARPSMHDEITIRMCGDNVTLMRVAWLELLDEMRNDSPLAARIRTRLAPIPTAWKQRANDRIACELGDHRACTHDCDYCGKPFVSAIAHEHCHD